MQQKVNRITDILRRDDGISGAMHYTEQVYWILFLKFLNDYEKEKADEVFNLKQGFNDKGEEIYFINFLKQSTPTYYTILSDKVKEFQEKPQIQNKYIWMMRYYHHNYNADALDPSLLEVVL